MLARWGEPKLPSFHVFYILATCVCGVSFMYFQKQAQPSRSSNSDRRRSSAADLTGRSKRSRAVSAAGSVFSIDDAEPQAPT